MPFTTEFIDTCRQAFGAEMVNNQIKLGMQGAQTFYAAENGIEVGTKLSEPVKFVTAGEMRLALVFDKPTVKRQ